MEVRLLHASPQRAHLIKPASVATWIPSSAASSMMSSTLMFFFFMRWVGVRALPPDLFSCIPSLLCTLLACSLEPSRFSEWPLLPLFLHTQLVNVELLQSLSEWDTCKLRGAMNRSGFLALYGGIVSLDEILSLPSYLHVDAMFSSQ